MPGGEQDPEKALVLKRSKYGLGDRRSLGMAELMNTLTFVSQNTHLNLFSSDIPDDLIQFSGTFQPFSFTAIYLLFK